MVLILELADKTQETVRWAIIFSFLKSACWSAAAKKANKTLGILRKITMKEAEAVAYAHKDTKGTRQRCALWHSY